MPSLTECENIIYITITIITIVVNALVALATFARAKFLLATFDEINVSPSLMPILATLKAAGAAGLLLGLLGVPVIGLAAAIGLVLFYLGAITAHLRAGAYRSLPSPAIFLALAVTTLVFMLMGIR